MKLLNKYPVIMIAVGVLGISMSAIFVRFSTAPSAVTAAYRLLWTVLLLSPVVLGKAEVRRQLLTVNRRTLLLSAASGILLALHFYTWFESLRHTSVASSTIIVCTEVIWVAIGYCLFLSGRLSGKAILAIGLALGGSVMVAWSDSSGGNGLWGDILSLIAAVAVGGYTLLGRTVRKDTSTTVYTYIVYCFCAATLLLLIALRGESLIAYGWSGPIMGLLLAVFCTLLGHSIFSWCLKYFSPTFVSASKLCEPVLSGVIAAILFGEIPGLLQLVGSAVILTGVIWYSVLEIRSESQ